MMLNVKRNRFCGYREMKSKARLALIRVAIAFKFDGPSEKVSGARQF